MRGAFWRKFLKAALLIVQLKFTEVIGVYWGSLQAIPKKDLIFEAPLLSHKATIKSNFPRVLGWWVHFLNISLFFAAYLRTSHCQGPLHPPDYGLRRSHASHPERKGSAHPSWATEPSNSTKSPAQASASSKTHDSMTPHRMHHASYPTYWWY